MDKASPGVYRLPQIIEIGQVAGFCAELRKLAAAGSPVVTLDLEDVVVADTAALQTLVCFVRTMQSRGGRVEWENLSVPVYMAACTLDLQDALGL
jgi:anti-anti-sigma regulatory factor